MSQVTFVVEADTAKAVSGFLKLVDAQKKMEGGFKGAVKAGNQLTTLQRSVDGISNTMQGMIAGYVGLAGLQRLGTMVADSMKEARGRTIEFHDEIRGIASLGGNINAMGQVKTEILDLSNAWGVSTKQIADGMYTIQSAAVDLPKNMQDDILTGALQFNRLQNTNIDIGAKALTKTYEIYGDQLANINQAKNKIYRTADLGDLNIEQAATFMPELLSSAKALGVSLDDVMGAIVVATQKGGRSEVTFTGLRNVFMKMPEAAKKFGITLQGDLIQQLQQLESLTPEQKLDLFGERALAVAQNLLSSVPALEQYRNDIHGIGADADDLSSRLTKLFADKGFAFGEKSKIFEQLNKNMPMEKGYVEQFGDTDLAFQARELGIKRRTPSYLSGLASPLAWLNTMARDTPLKYLPGVAAQSWVMDKFMGEDAFRASGESMARDAAIKTGRGDLFGATPVPPAGGVPEGGGDSVAAEMSGSATELSNAAAALHASADALRQAAQQRQNNAYPRQQPN